MEPEAGPFLLDRAREKDECRQNMSKVGFLVQKLSRNLFIHAFILVFQPKRNIVNSGGVAS